MWGLHECDSLTTGGTHSWHGHANYAKICLSMELAWFGWASRHPIRGGAKPTKRWWHEQLRGRGWSALESIEDALAQCLELIIDNNLDIEACVALYPQWESELRELLRLAVAIRSLDGRPALPPEQVRQIRERIFRVPDQQPQAGG